MTRFPRRFLLLGVLVIAALLAFPLRDTISQMIVVPVAYIGWELGLFYHSLSQMFWWWLIILLVVIMLVLSLVPEFSRPHREKLKSRLRYGPVEDLAAWLGRARSGTYFKWLIANRLGKLAYQILLHRESGRPRSLFAPLLGQDWEPSDELRNYLEIGLHGSFSEFPATTPWFGKPHKTPLDYEIREAVDFLEAQVKNGRLGL